MADLTARPDHWTDSLPGNWQQAINTNGILNALGRALSRQAPDMTRGIEHDQYGSVSDRNWLLQQAAGGPPKMNPLAAEMLDKGGLLANFLGPGVKLPAAAPKPTGIRAYHGSPHDFDRFDINKIGTGEGAQAYGRGLYFAESEGVAKSYRDNLQRPAAFVPSVNGRVMTREELPLVDTMRFRGGFDGAIDYLTKSIGEMDKARAGGWFAREQPKSQSQIEYERQLGILSAWRDSGARVNWERPPPQPGRMYEVRINAHPEQFLDWDKPLSQQPERVRRAFPDNLHGMRGSDAHTELAAMKAKPLAPDADTGWTSVVNTINDRVQNPDGASKHLRDAGIPGIKYLDQMSRTAGEGSRNYVVFDDKLIEILRKYGLLPPVAAGTAAALNQQEPPL